MIANALGEPNTNANPKGFLLLGGKEKTAYPSCKRSRANGQDAVRNNAPISRACSITLAKFLGCIDGRTTNT